LPIYAHPLIQERLSNKLCCSTMCNEKTSSK